MYIFDSEKDKMADLNNYMGKHVTVMFFLKDGCGYCEDLKPTLSRITSDLRNSDLNGGLARVNTNNLTDMKYKRDINGVPTISIFKDGKYNKEDYNGSRSYDDLKQFLLNVYKQNKHKNTLSRVKKKFKKMGTNDMKKYLIKTRKKKSKNFWKSFSKKFRKSTKKKSKKQSKKLWKKLSTNLSKVVKSMKKAKKKTKKKKAKKKNMEGGRRRKRRRSKSKRR